MRVKDRVSLSGSEKTIQTIWEWYEYQSELAREQKAELVEQIRRDQPPDNRAFLGMTLDEVDEFFAELDYLAMFDLMAATEAAIRVDFLNRVYNRRPKDGLTARFRDLYRKTGSRTPLDEGILECWRDIVDATQGPISDFKGAINFRHWVAHGRYWTAKVGRNYSPSDIYDIAYAVLDRMGLLTHTA